MPTLLMLKGLPASGKSTFAKKLVVDSQHKTEQWKRINKDDLRAMIDGGQWSRDNEKFILEVRDAVITHAFFYRHNVVVDDTNFEPRHEAELRELADTFRNILPKIDIKFEVRMFDTPLAECIRRDAARPKPVGEAVIRDMYNRHLAHLTTAAGQA